MSVSKWAYNPLKCDGDFCPQDCDICPKRDEDNDLAEFLEDVVQQLWDMRPDIVGVVAIDDVSGTVGLNYHNCTLEDKGRIVHQINLDIVNDYITNNIGTIHDMLVKWEEGDEEDDDVDE